ncbi:DUF4249 domain-containing protein [Fibrella aquatilis]|uniref:DUF4249 domain-containing protein n=1 Tax=Fibrella aquatilis TaxID=2817059 RepID=A0A939JZX9_9BACT|nr:DUF4249 domain-containing protein [Fibrella aquatilis]MBO0931406.1 DUF4249 domain-containing protein [Fibrella aquatilis]
MTTLCACGNLTSEVDPAVLGVGGEKLVVNSYISPQDTLLTVKVSRSKPAVSGSTTVQPFNVNNATVSLSDGSRSIVLKYNNLLEYYAAKPSLLPIRAGQTYTLTATTPDGKQVTAQATVPASVPISAVALDSVITSSATEWKKTFRVSFAWEGLSAKTNYYAYCGYFSWNNKVSYRVAGQTQTAVPEVTELTFPGENGTGNLLSDNNLSGKRLSSQSAEVTTLSLGKGENNAATAIQHLTIGKSLPGARLTLRLLNTDSFYYTYTSAVQRQRQAGSNPFAEPVLIPTNIQGGLGCFAAYNRTEKVVVLK